MKYKLYILKEKEVPLSTCDICSGFIICAQSQKKARKLASWNAGDEGAEFWLNANHSSCKELKPSKTAEIIMRDFCNG